MDANREKLASRYREQVLQLTVVGEIAASWLLHEPVYDCVADEFHLPCGRFSFEAGSFSTDCGWLKSEQSVCGWASSHANHDVGATSVLVAPDHLTFMWSPLPHLPGARIYRLVRVRLTEWFECSWRSGYRPSAADIDPPFVLDKITTQQWLSREREASEQGQSNRSWQTEANNCRHRRRLL